MTTGIGFYTVTIKDAVTEMPITNAVLTGSYNGGTGIRPFDSLHIGNGMYDVGVGEDFSSWYGWQVTASGYTTQTGSGAPPLTIYLSPTTQPTPTPSPTPTPTPTEPTNWVLIAAVAAIIVALILLIWWWRKK